MLPDFLTPKKQPFFLNYYLIWTPFILVYQVTNRFHFIEVRQLPMTWLDNAIPFIPWTIPVYISYLVYTFLVISRSRDDNEVREIFILTHIQLGLAVFFFVFTPVSFPRDQFYYTNPVTSTFNEFWLWFDAPANCFPSLHAILCMTGVRYSLKKPYKWLYVSWGILIIISTLTCKQHYIVDIAAAAVLFPVSLKLFQVYCSWIPGKIPVAPPSKSDQ
jgi:membrane-associated phospholipid phosphatase